MFSLFCVKWVPITKAFERCDFFKQKKINTRFLSVFILLSTYDMMQRFLSFTLLRICWINSNRFHLASSFLLCVYIPSVLNHASINNLWNVYLLCTTCCCVIIVSIFSLQFAEDCNFKPFFSRSCIIIVIILLNTKKSQYFIYNIW